MRVLHLDSGREMGGGQWQVLRLIEGLTAAGVECLLQARRGSPLFRMAAAGPLRLPLAPADLVHAHDARSHTLAALVGRKPLVVSRRVAFPVRNRWKYRRATHYIAVSEFVKGVLMEGGVAESRITVVHDGVRPLPDGRGSVAPLGYKDTNLALAAARSAGIPLRTTGDLESDLPGSAFLVYLSHCEGLGSGILMAMSAGVPVIASSVGGIPEIIEHERNGLLTRNDPEAVAAAMRRLTDNPDLAQLLATRARQTVQERFTVDGMVRRTLQVYEQVLAC